MLSRYFDHTALKADVTVDLIDNICSEAIKYNFASVCVNSCHIDRVRRNLEAHQSINPCIVVGFPLGTMATECKVYESIYSIQRGAKEIDMVINIGLVKSQRLDEVRRDIEAVVAACHENSAICKTILETCYLTTEEKTIISQIAVDCGADFLKTSTGFGSAGATEDDVRLLAEIAHKYDKKVKASGGIRDGKTALAMIRAGADRLGTSATVAVFNECTMMSE